MFRCCCPCKCRCRKALSILALYAMSNDTDVCLFSARQARKKRQKLPQQSRVKKSARTLSSPAERATHSERDEAALRSESTASKNSFSDIGLSEHLSSVCSALGMPRPTAVQVGSAARSCRRCSRKRVARLGRMCHKAFNLNILVCRAGRRDSCCPTWR